MKKSLLLALFLTFGLLSLAQEFPIKHSTISEWEYDLSKWKEIEDVNINPINLKANTQAGKGVWFTNSASQMASKVGFNDVKISFQYMVGKETKASLRVGSVAIDLSEKAAGDLYNGLKASQNVSMAPGLWQHMSLIISRKGSNLLLEYINLNEVLIQQNVFLPNNQDYKIVFENKTGPFALKDVSLASYSDKKPISVNNISYEIEDTFGWDKTFEIKGTPRVSGTTEILKPVPSVSSREFINYFKADLHVDIADTYAITLDYQGVCQLSIDGVPVVGSKEYIFRVPETKTIKLTPGKHQLELRYQRIWWSPGFGIFVSGSDFRPYALHDPKSLPAKELVGGISIEEIAGIPKIIRGFIEFGKEKRTEVISIGTPEQRHFSFDLSTASLLYAWKGKFADLTEMWFERGEPQILMPMGQSIAFLGKCPIVGKEAHFQEYYLDKNGIPTFNHTIDGALLSQKFEPTSSGLKVEIGSDDAKMEILLSEKEGLQKLSESLYRSKDHYLKIANPKAIRISAEGQLMANVNLLESYEIQW